MKYFKIILLLTCLMQVKLMNAQGNNLQFNQAIYTTIVGIGGQFTQVPITVPANKIWKIESASCSIDSQQGTQNIYLSLNGVVITAYTLSVGQPSYSSCFPIWLPSGSYGINLYNSGGNGGPIAVGFISGVEYNLVP